ncbi:MAG: LysR family transcriptional regulator [Alphaproteobacteria bacterium]|nr:LysR family transcriptional regulator [Alphaproteobacteria bacterium]
MIQLRLKQLAYFAAAAESLNVSIAAAALNVSQPAVSAAIAEIERRYGTQLFLRRHARGLTLTPAGQRFLAASRALLAHAREVEASFVAEADEPAGIVSAGCFVTLAPYVMPRLLASLAQAHPAIEVDMIEGNQEELQAALRDGRIEIAVTYDYGPAEALAASPLALLPPRAVLPARHPLARRRRVAMAELAPLPLVLLDMPHTRDYFSGLFAAAGILPRIARRTRSYELARALVGRGLGYTILNAVPGTAATYDGGAVAVRPLADPLPPIRVVAVRAAEHPPRRAVRAVLGHLEERAAGWLGAAPPRDG